MVAAGGAKAEEMPLRRRGLSPDEMMTTQNVLFHSQPLPVPANNFHFWLLSKSFRYLRVQTVPVFISIVSYLWRIGSCSLLLM